ncbi:type VII secretion protein EccE [Streptomyces aidingensis]|uniref:Putative type VII ESX secretion system translocon, EccE n=1 Tax=Streptomyces aidingensis TaxID=910347 RepID=A0A1I1PUQ0_9ACTN|nr:type VII secretion protein EccE [Streptomyces aidingensis]SFD09620.1 Putative type VII ESX secretion system translocon, EccE [Streptomyces aidingensis]
MTAAGRRGPGGSVRARLVAAEAGAGAALAGVALPGAWGYALTGAGVLAAVGGPVRVRGERAGRRLPARLRRGTPAPGPAPGAGAGPGPERLGAAQTLLPALTVTEAPDRNIPGPDGLGVAGDGRGHATVAAFPGGMLPALPAAAVARWLAEDPARPAAAQIVVERFAVPSWDMHYHYPPTAAYRGLPGAGTAVAVRSWLVVRCEPLEAPRAIALRGGGQAGAHAALAAAARLRARLAARGAPTVPLTAASTRDLLRHLGDPEPDGRALRGSWAGRGAAHATLTAEVASRGDWFRLLAGLARCSADRVVVAATLTAEGGELRVRTAVRVVSALPQHAAAQRDALHSAGITGPPGRDQSAGLLATLPLAHPGRPLAEAAGLTTAAVPFSREAA